MVRRYALWTAAALAVLVSTAAQAAEDVYHAIPSDSLAFVVVNRIAETSAKVQKLGQLVGAPPVGLLELAKASAGVKKGLDETRSAALVVMAGKNPRNNGDTAPVFLIPVSDYKQFLGSWNAKPTEKIVEVKIGGDAALMGQRGDYAAIVPKEFRSALEKLLDAKRSIADDHPQLVPWLLENDGVAVATSHGIKMASEEMQRELKQTQEMFSRMGEESESAMPMMAITTMQMYVNFLKWAAKDVEIIAAGARADKENTVRVATRTRFVKDSAFAATLAKLQPRDTSPLLGMPGGTFFAAGGGAWADSLSEGIVVWQTAVMKQSFRMAYDLDEKAAEQLVKKILEMPKGIRSMSMMIGPGQPGEPILSDMLAVYRVDDGKKYLGELEKYYQAIDVTDKDSKAAEKKLFSVKKTEVGGRPALETEMAMPLSPKAKDSAEFEEAMKKMFGPGGKFKNLIVAVDDHTIAISFGDSSPLVMRAIAALKQPADGLAADADVVKTAAMLPAGAQWTGYVSPSGAVAFVKWVIDTAMSEAAYGFKPNIPDFPASPPIGIAVKAVPGELHTEIVVSSAVLEAIGKYVGIVQSAEHPEVP